MRRVLIKVMLAAVLVMTLASCPDPVTGKIDPYLTTKTSIAFAKSSLVLADALFENILVYAKIVGDKAKDARTKYAKAKDIVTKTLAAAEAGLEIAMKANKGVDVMTIMMDTDRAWKALRDLIASFMPSTTSTASADTPPSAQPRPHIEQLPYSIIKRE